MKKTLIALGVAVGVLFPVGSFASNGLQSEMDKLFNGMSNYTPAGVYETQRRGVLSGGRVTVKTKIFDENLVSFAPPSWKAGCGGVDLYGGSLSFINADQIVQLLRAVAANAKGYAFQLALDNVFPDGAKWIENFQKKVQDLNQHLSNSCQLAQGIVNDATSGMNIKHKTDASIKATTSGLYEDFFSSKSESTGRSPSEELKTNAPGEYEKQIGNIIWKQLKANGVHAWFQYGDDTLLESIMSLTGTVIIGDLVDDPNSSSGSKTNTVVTLPGTKITLGDLINGGAAVEIYSCDEDPTNCLGAGTSLGTKTIDITGLRTQIINMLLGTSTSPGVVYKYSANSSTLNEEEKAFVSTLPGGAGTIIRNLSVLSHSSAVLFAQESADALALSYMYNMTEEFFRAGRLALSNSQSAYKDESLKVLSTSQDKIRSEYSVLVSQYGDLTTQIQRYNSMLENIRKQKYMMSSLTTPKSAK